ncbi:MAG: 2-hydroxyacid dehydrogenase [Lachnospiraceae bacterium]|nr:2-hydroxyacid dehydrogenase [Lachnospiraceae bacterium]
MLNELVNKSLNIVAVGDFFVSSNTMEEAIKTSKLNANKITKLYWGVSNNDEWAEHQLNIEKNGPEAEPYPSELDNLIEECDVLMVHFCPVPKKLIDKGKNLKAIITCRGGLEHIDVNAASEKNIAVINVVRNAVPVAEFTIGLMLSVTRNIAASHMDLINGKWTKVFPNQEFVSTLSNLTIGLVGMGNIGIEMAIRLKSFGCKIIAYDPYLDKDRIKRNDLDDCVSFKDKIEDVFSEADMVSLHMRLVPETEKMIDKRLFSLMKPTSYFINGARGGLINQDDLIDALKNKKIAGAALDVFDTEPLADNSELKNFKNVVLTPHIAGATVDAIPKSPFLLMKEVDKIVTKGTTDRIVNYKDI